MKSSGRSSRGYLSIGQKPGSTNKNRTVFISFCTAKDKSGTQYLVKDNIEKVFCQYVKEGKATIRLKSPQIDLRISKTDAIQLKSFLTVLKGCLQGVSPPPSNQSLTVLVPVAAKHLESCKKKLSIFKRQDYPLLKGFPKSLTHLLVSCSLKKIDPRIVQLKFLQILDFTGNLLEELPNSFCNLSLSELILKQNQFTSLPLSLLEPPIVDCLTHLDVSENKIKRLPENLDRLKQLLTLQASHNQLERLPATIGKLKKLKSLFVSNNQIPLLAASVVNLHLTELDVAHNKFDSTRACIVQHKNQFPSLQTLCAETIVANRIPYSDENLFQHLHSFVKNYHWCWCGKRVFDRFIQCVFHSNLSFMTASLHLAGSDRTIPIEAYFCSQKCCDRFTLKCFTS